MTAAENTDAAVEFQDVVKGFDGRAVLDLVTFKVMPGEVVCILGRSGTGKSVTLKLMIGLLIADRGQVKVGGRDLATLNETQLAGVRRKMGYMFQGAALFDSFTLSENVAMPLYRLKGCPVGEIQERVREQLRSVGLENDGDKMPSALSGGMQKRAGLARALVLRPKILLVDEPSSGLDRITTAEIDSLLIDVKEKRHTTMVIVTHDVRGARKIADKFAVLDKSRLLAFGTPQELDERGDSYVEQFISER